MSTVSLSLSLSHPQVFFNSYNFLKECYFTLFNTPPPVVGSREDVKVGEITVRGREYPWGVVEIENEQHCDFVKLREMLIRTNMEDLREVGLFNHNHLFFVRSY